MGFGHANAGYRRLFESDGLTFGAGFPLTGANRSSPDVDAEIRLAKHAESVGFDALWARDVPTYWPRFGDAGQTFDTWPWLTHVAANTDDVALGTSSVVLPSGIRSTSRSRRRPSTGSPRAARPRRRLRRP